MGFKITVDNTKQSLYYLYKIMKETKEQKFCRIVQSICIKYYNQDEYANIVRMIYEEIYEKK
jgi:hypothetical protein